MSTCMYVRRVGRHTSWVVDRESVSRTLGKRRRRQANLGVADLGESPDQCQRAGKQLVAGLRIEQNQSEAVGYK